MEKFWNCTVSLKTFSSSKLKTSASPARKIRYLPFPKRYLLIGSQKDSHKNRRFCTPTPKIAKSPPPSKSDPHFQPKTKLYIELSSSPSPYDLRSKNLQKDIKSAQKILNYEEMDNYKEQVRKDYKALTKKDIRKVATEREDLLNLGIEAKKVHKKAVELFKAVKQGDTKGVSDMLTEFPELLRETDVTGQTALHWAVRRKYVGLVEMLLGAGASVMVKDMVGRRPEDIARKKKLTTISDMLIAARRRTANVSRIFVSHGNQSVNPIVTLMSMKVRRVVENLNNSVL